MTQFALITGATSGLGEAGVVALGKKGYTVLLAGRDASRGAAVVSTIKNVCAEDDERRGADLPNELSYDLKALAACAAAVLA